MDVRFCEGRNHRREARVRAAGSARVRRARSSEARLRRIFFSLTKTYMDVGKPEVGQKKRAFEERGPICNDNSAWHHVFSQQGYLVA
jgi:hypothetical protein